MNKSQQYEQLILQRKDCRKCMELDTSPAIKIVNPSQYPEFDTQEIGHWSMWQKSLSAKILLVGQDWGGTDYFFKYRGKDIDDNPTNQKLMKLFNILGYDIGTPNSPIKNGALFFTNSILCIKQGRMDGRTENQWHDICANSFLKPLIELLNLNLSSLIALGEKAYQVIHKLYFPNKSIAPLKSVVASQIQLTDSLFLYPVYHCGTRSINLNRKFKLQEQDWLAIRRLMDNQ